MVDILAKVNTELKEEGFPEVDIGIGVNSGMATVGNMGSKIRFDYTAIGDTVNLSSRLEGLNKVYKTRIIISENTLKKLVDDFLYRQLDRVRVKGKNIPINIYEIMKNTEKNQKIKEKFDLALEHYFRADFNNALKTFEKIYNEFSDETSKVFIDRCKQFIQNPPDENWDGTFNLTTK
jgi:adenylate cyclase